MREEPGVPDWFRKKHGWKGEMALFRAANEQHKVKHKTMDINCKTCVVITRNLARLVDEGKELTQLPKK